MSTYLKYCVRAFILVAVSLVFTRLFFGIDFTDECQYVAQALGPLIGGKAYVTDRFFQQSGSLWATPFLWLYIQLVGSTEGIVLFFRGLYFGTSFLTGFFLFKAFRKSMKFDPSLALSVLPVLYIPFAIPAMSYNTMALQMTLTSLALLRLLKSSKRIGIAFALAVSSAMAIVSYPSLALAFGILLVWEYRDQSFRPWINKTVLFSVAAMLIFSIPLILAGSEQIQKNFAVARAVSLFTWEAKWNVSLFYLRSLLPDAVYLVVALAAAVVLWFFKKPMEFLLIPFLLVFYVMAAPSIELDTASGFIIYAVIGALIFVSVQKIFRREPWILGIEVFMGFIVGLSVGLTSTNGLLNACLGFSIALVFLLESALKLRGRFPWLAWVMIALFYIFAPWSFFYREGRLPELSHQIDSGPFYGIYTNSLKSEFLKQLSSDLKSLPKSAKSIFVYDSFPAGYLFSDLHPKTFLYYMHPYLLSPGLRPELQQMFAVPENEPDIILEMLALPISEKSVLMIQKGDQNISKDPFWGFFKNHADYKVLASGPMYVIYGRKNLF